MAALISAAHPHSLGIHDLGGRHATNKPVDVADPPLQFWEQRVHALEGLLEDAPNVNFKADELRAGIEALHPEVYATAPYYGKWALSIARAMERRGLVKMADMEEVMGLGSAPEPSSPRFREGDSVTVRHEKDIWPMPYRKPHMRTPGYVHGITGEVVKCLDEQEDPGAAAFGQDTRAVRVYAVRFRSSDVWPNAAASGGDADACVDVDIYEPWLVLASEDARRGASQPEPPSTEEQGDFANAIERRRIEVEAQMKENPHAGDSSSAAAYETFATGLIDRLTNAGVIKAEDLHQEVETCNSRSAKPLGPSLVARAWLDPAFKQLLLRDADAAVKEINGGAGLAVVLDPHDHSHEHTHEEHGHEAPVAGGKVVAGSRLIILENTAEVHNVVVCTLCSCYPLGILGYSPAWYKSMAYRARVVREPRAVLAEFGLALPPSVQVRVHDSLSDKRYLVLPQRPAGTDGWSESDLQALVIRDSMVGVALARPSSSE